MPRLESMGMSVLFDELSQTCSSCYIFLLTFGIVGIFNFSHSGGCAGSICISGSLMMWVPFQFICHLDYCFRENVGSSLLSIFLLSFLFFLMICKTSYYVFKTNPLLVICIVNISSHCVAGIFILLMMYLNNFFKFKAI